MIEPICKNCVYFKKEITDLSANGGDKNYTSTSCDCPKFITGYHKSVNQIGIDECLVESDEGWCFQPNDNFGCVHFNPII
jgi:hypothetical protein